LDEIKKIFDLLDLEVRWFENLRRAGVIVYNSNTQDFKSHLASDVFPDSIVFDRLLKFSHGVIVLVSQLPPLGAKLTDAADLVYFK
jgi:hypothetical protein